MWCHDTIYDFEKIPDMHLNNKYIQQTVMAVSTFTETVSGHVIINFVSFCSLFQHVLKILQRRYVEYTFKRNLSFMWSMVFHNFFYFLYGPQAWFGLGATTAPNDGKSSVLLVSGTSHGASLTTNPWSFGPLL